MKFSRFAIFIVISAFLQKPALTQALTVVSDIDDTVKISNVLNPIDAVYRETIAIRAFTGMPQTYSGWKFDAAPTFVYLSGSPVWLRNTVQNFLNRYEFPAGELILKKSGEGDVGTYKVTHLREILAKSNDQFVLIGDDTQKDFSSYAQIAKEFPGRVEAIYIHAIRGMTLPADAKAAQETTFLTSIDLAMNLYLAGAISLNTLTAVSLEIQTESFRHRILPEFQHCPKNYLSVTGPNEEANAVIAPTQKIIRKLCDQAPTGSSLFAAPADFDY